MDKVRKNISTQGQERMSECLAIYPIHGLNTIKIVEPVSDKRRLVHKKVLFYLTITSTIVVKIKNFN